MIIHEVNEEVSDVIHCNINFRKPRQLLSHEKTLVIFLKEPKIFCNFCNQKSTEIILYILYPIKSTIWIYESFFCFE